MTESEDAWETELEALTCIAEAKNVRVLPYDPHCVDVQILYGTEDDEEEEYWLRVHRPSSYPNAPLTVSALSATTKLETPVDTTELAKLIEAAAGDASAVGAEALFSVVTCAQDFVRRCIERDTGAALRVAAKVDLGDGPLRKHIGRDTDLLEVYRTLDLLSTTVLLTPCASNPLRHALARNIRASIELYERLHGQGLWSHLTLDALWEVGFDVKDKSFAARRFKERRHAVGQAKKRQLLWHGSALHAIACILTNGSLRQVQRAAHGRMFGDGVYFADCMCKALTYCSGGRPDEFYLLLCSVNLDDSFPTSAYLDDVDPQVLASKRTLAVQGNLYLAESQRLETGDTLAVGRPTVRNHQQCAVNFNEYIVAKEDGHVNRYLARLKVPPAALEKRRVHGF